MAQYRRPVAAIDDSRMRLQPAHRCFRISHRSLESSPAAPRSTPPPVKPYSSTTPPPIVKEVAKKPPHIAFPKVEAPDPARGYEAAIRAAQTGKLDQRYKPAARRMLSILVGVPFVIVLGWELYQRRFQGKEPRRVA